MSIYDFFLKYFSVAFSGNTLYAYSFIATVVAFVVVAVVPFVLGVSVVRNHYKARFGR